MNFPSTGWSLHEIEQINEIFETFLTNDSLKLIPKNTILTK